MSENRTWLDAMTDGQIIRDWFSLIAHFALGTTYISFFIFAYTMSIGLSFILIGIPLLLFTLASTRARISAPSSEETVRVAIRLASALPKPSRTSARAITAHQPANASRPAAVISADCGAASSKVVAIGQPSRKPDLAIHPASSLQ